MYMMMTVCTTNKHIKKNILSRMNQNHLNVFPIQFKENHEEEN